MVLVDSRTHDHHDCIDWGCNTCSSGASTSLAESVLNFPWEHGRRYHSDRAGHYAMPNDDVSRPAFRDLSFVIQTPF